MQWSVLVLFGAWQIVNLGVVSVQCAKKCLYPSVGVPCETPVMDHDAAWKRLFGLPVLIEHLLKGFARPVAERLDLSTLRQLPANSVDADAGNGTATRPGAWITATAADARSRC